MEGFIGVDIGGTETKVGMIRSGKLEYTAFRTQKDASILNEDIARAIESISNGKIVAVGVGCPGAINSLAGTIDYSNNLGFLSVPLGDMLQRRLGANVKLSNDANVAALGESIFGKNQSNNTVMITLGTGFGSGIIIDGKIFEGAEGKGAEIGHIIIETDGELCSCGMRGCLEAYASATALIRQTVKAMEEHPDSLMWQICPSLDKVDGKVAFDAERMGDSHAKKIVDAYVKYLSIGVINICNIFRPETIIVGGGVGNQGENLLKRIRAYCKRFNYGYTNTPIPKVVSASLKNTAGIYGGIALAKIYSDGGKTHERFERNQDRG